MKKLNSRAYLFHKIIDYTGVVLLVGLLLFIWQLYRAPIAIPLLKPYIIKALNHDDAEYQVTLDSVNLELVRSIIPVHIIASNVKYRKNDGSFSIDAPKTSVSFSMKALLRGVIAPSSIEVNNPSVYIFTSYGLKKDNEQEAGAKTLEFYIDNFDEFIERFNSSDKSYAESYINSISINHAEVEFHEVDLGRKWSFSDVNYSFNRNFRNIETDINALLKLNDRISSLGLSAEYRPSTNKLGLQLYFSELIPADLIDNFMIAGEKPENYHIRLPLSGKVNTLVNFDEIIKHRDNWQQSLDTAVEKMHFEIEGGKGEILFTGKDEDAYAVSSFAVDGNLGAGLNQLKIENAKFDLDGLPAELSFSVSGLKKYFLYKSLDDLKFSLNAKVQKLAFAELSKYWPRYIAPDAWAWCKESLLGGFAKNADFTFDFAYDKKSGGIAFENLSGKGEIEDGTLFYLSGMPNITKMYGTAEFTPGSIDISVEKAVSDGVEVDGGYVRLYDLDKENNFADIRLTGRSSVTDVLKLIDHQPLGYTSEMGLDPDKIKGWSENDLGLKFELKNDLEPEEVHVDVKANIKDLEMPDVIDGKPIFAPELSLSVTNKGMLLEGNATFEKIPLKLVWEEDFNKKDYKSKYKISFRFDENFKKIIGLTDISFINPPYISGHLDVDAYITSYEDNRMVIDLDGNLKSADVDYSFFGLRKPAGQNGTAKAKLEFIDNKLKSIPSFSLAKQDFSFAGKVVLDGQGDVKLVDVTKIKGPKTDARAKIEFLKTPQEKVKINVSGTSYDLSELFARNEDKLKQQHKQAKSGDDTDLENVATSDVNIAVNRLWTNELVSVRNFAGSAKLVHGIGVQEMHLIGNFGSSREAMMKLDYTPRKNGEYFLTVDSNNAGSTLKVLRLYDNMSGGILSIEAKRDKNKNFIGHAKIRDFSIYNTPVLAKLFTVASLTGMLNLLSGEGMAFSHFDAPFEYKDKTLYTTEAKAFGPVMGITANGSVSRITETYNIKGVIAPAYSLNTFIGKLPLVGSLLSGKDGTVFAANYKITGSLSDPNVSINPLSALSPSSLKDLFRSTFGSGNDR